MPKELVDGPELQTPSRSANLGVLIGISLDINHYPLVISSGAIAVESRKLNWCQPLAKRPITHYIAWCKVAFLN